MPSLIRKLFRKSEAPNDGLTLADGARSAEEDAVLQNLSELLE